MQDKTFWTENSVTITLASPVPKDEEENFFGGGWTWNEQFGLYVALDSASAQGVVDWGKGALCPVSRAEAAGGAKNVCDGSDSVVGDDWLDIELDI